MSGRVVPVRVVPALGQIGYSIPTVSPVGAARARRYRQMPQDVPGAIGRLREDSGR